MLLQVLKLIGELKDEFKKELVTTIVASLKSELSTFLLSGQDNELLTIEGLSSKLKISKSSIVELRKKGLPVIRIQNSVRYNWDDVINFLKENNQKIGSRDP